MAEKGDVRMYRACGQEHTLPHTHIEAPKGLAKTTVPSRGDNISIHKSFLERIGTTILGTDLSSGYSSPMFWVRRLSV